MSRLHTCPNCRQQLEIPAEFAGKLVRCPQCKDQFPAGGENPAVGIVVQRGEGARQPVSTPVGGSRPSLRGDPGRRRPSVERFKDISAKKQVRWPIVLGALGVASTLMCVIIAAISSMFSEPPPPRFVFQPQFVVPPNNPFPPLPNDGDFPPNIGRPLVGPKNLFVPMPNLIAPDLEPLFSDLQFAFSNKDKRSIIAHFDMGRLLDTCLEADFLPIAKVRNRDRLAGDLHQEVDRQLDDVNCIRAWDMHEIRSVDRKNPDRPVVIVRHLWNNGTVAKIRWYLSRTGGRGEPATWRVYDFENLDVSLRLSTAVISIVDDAQIQAMAHSIPPMRDAIIALQTDRKGKVNEAEGLLKQVENQKLPAKLKAFHQLALGLLRVNQGKPAEAIDAFDKVQALDPRLPVLDMFRGFALNALYQSEKALSVLEKYHKLVGDDLTLCHSIGVSLQAMGRIPEARAQFRKALDHNDQELSVFLSLLRTFAAGEDRGDLGKRFARFDQIHECFEACVKDCKLRRDGESLLILAQAMARIDPNHESIDNCLVLAFVWSNRTNEAVIEFQRALRKLNDPARRREFTASFGQAMAASNKAILAYQIMLNADEAFSILASELVRSYQNDELRKLVQAHAKRRPKDPLLPCFQAQIHCIDLEYDLAEQAFAKGMNSVRAKQLDKLVLDNLQRSWIAARFHLGKALAAYADIGQRGQTFQELAGLCFSNSKYDVLEKLVEEHAKFEADSPLVARYRFQMKIRQDRIKEGTVLFQAALAKVEEGGDARRQLVTNFVYDMVDAGHGVEAYRAVSGEVNGFSLLAEDLLGQRRLQDLRDIVKLHEQDHADDPWLRFYKAQILVEDKAWGEAARLLEMELKKAPKLGSDRFRSLFVLAMYRAGQGLEAYGRVEQRKETFHQLAGLMFADKKADELRDLVNEHLPHAGDDPDVLFYQVRAQIILKQTKAATRRFQDVYAAQKIQFRRQEYVGDFVRDMAGIGQALEGYRAVPELGKMDAFRALAYDLLRQLKKDGLLDQLVAEHADNYPHDPLLPLFRGELLMRRGQPLLAELEFSNALAKSAPQVQWEYRNALSRARVKAGRTVTAYRELGPSARTFEDLALICLAQKNTKELAALIAAHRDEFPKDKNLDVWLVEFEILNKNYQAALNALNEHLQGGVIAANWRWKYSNMKVRCLVKLNRAEEAVREAEEGRKSRTIADVMYVMAHAATADVKRTIAAVERCRADRYLLEGCYRDEDLGPILRGEGFQEFREKYPE